MKVNLNETLKDLRGNPFVDKSTYRSVIETVLLVERSGSETTFEEKKLRFKLAVKIAAIEVGEVEFSAAEIVLITRLTGSLYPPLIVGRICELFGELEAA